jgi:hypothetical protein
MSDAAAQAEAPKAPEVEAAEAQGAESTGSELYSAFLEGVPEEIHDQVIGALKAQDAEFTKKFQSRSERVKPFEELGILDQDPQAVGQYLQLDQAIAAARQGDEQAQEAVYQWWDKVGEALEFYESGEGGGEGEDVSEELDPLEMDAKTFQEAVQRQVEQQVGPIAQHLQAQQQAEAQQQALAEANDQIDGWISEIKSANPSVFEGEAGEQALEEVLTLSELYIGEDNPVAAGFAKYQSLVSKGEAGLFAQKQQQPQVPEGAGKPNTAPAIPTMKNARDVALEYVRHGKANG